MTCEELYSDVRYRIKTQNDRIMGLTERVHRLGLTKLDLRMWLCRQADTVNLFNSPWLVYLRTFHVNGGLFQKSRSVRYLHIQNSITSYIMSGRPNQMLCILSFPCGTLCLHYFYCIQYVQGMPSKWIKII